MLSKLVFALSFDEMKYDDFSFLDKVKTANLVDIPKSVNQALKRQIPQRSKLREVPTQK